MSRRSTIYMTKGNRGIVHQYNVNIKQYWRFNTMCEQQYWRFSSCYVAADASVLCAVGAILRSWTGKLGKKQSSFWCFCLYGYEMWNVIYKISVSIIAPLYCNSVFDTSLGYNQRSCKVSANQNLKCYNFTLDFWATALHTQRQHMHRCIVHTVQWRCYV